MQPTSTRPLIISFRIESMLGWGAVLVLCAIPVFMWASLNPISEINNWSAFLKNAGRITGLVGMVLYALNLVMATRLRILEDLFGGLNRVYIAHHILGGFALILLAFHPLVLAIRLVKISFYEAAMFILPNGLAPLSAFFNSASPYHDQVLQEWAIFFGTIAFWGMVVLLLVTFFIRIPYNIWLFTHKFLGLFFAIAGLHILFITSDTSVSTPLKVYMLALTFVGLVAFLYRLFAGKILVRRYNYTVEQVTSTSPGVYDIALQPSGNRLMFKPGQFVYIRFMNNPGISHEWHPFTISSSPKDARLTIAAKALGDFTSKLGNLQAGTIAEIEGAYGKFSHVEHHNKNQIWIAGGIGITPFLSMAADLPEGDFQIDLYYSIKTASEAINWPLLYNTAINGQGKFRVIPYIGDQQQGHLSADYIEQNSGGVDKKDIYICGPPAMMDSLRSQFRAKSVPATSIHTEEFAMT